MAPFPKGYTNGATQALSAGAVRDRMERFKDIPPAIDIPVSGIENEEAVEVNLEDLLDDPTELCTLLENEKAPKNLWMTISLAYAKQNQIDHAIEILHKGLAALGRGGPKDKLGLLGCLCWLYLLKSRHAPRVASEGQLVAEAKTKDHFLREATSTINDASRINPAFPPLFLTRGVMFLLKSSLSSAPKVAGASGNDVSERIELLRQALKSFQDASKSSGGRNLMATLGIARAQYLLGRYQEALAGYQEVLMKMPGLTDPDPRIGIGCCLWQLGFRDQAKAAWERSLALNPDSKVGNTLLGIYYLWDSSRHSSEDPAFSTLYKIAMTQYIQKAFKLDKEFPLTCATFSSYFLLRKSYAHAETLARKAIELTDVNAIASDGWYLLARKEHQEGNYAKANDYYNRADQARGGVDKGFLPAKFGSIQMQILTKDVDGAKFRLEKLIQQTQNPEAMNLLGALSAEEVFASQASGSKEDKSAEAKKAITLLEGVRSAWKDEKKKLVKDEAVLLYLTRLYEASQPDKSMECLQQVEAMQAKQVDEKDLPEDLDLDDEAAIIAAAREHLPPQLLNNIACFLNQSNKLAEALDMFQKALSACVKRGDREDESDSDTDALVTTISYNLARTYEAFGSIEEATKVYEGLLERHSDYTDASARLTYIALEQSPADDGPENMKKLYETDSTNIEVRALFGWYLSRSKKRVANIAEDNEQRHYKHTLQGFDKHDKYSLTGMGNIYLLTARDMRRETDQDKEKRHKMYEKAVEFFDKALQLDPRNAYAAQGIAIALVDDKKDFSTAVQIFTRVRDTVRDASVYINLGHTYSELRQYQRSIENYEIALGKSRQENPQILACLARVYLLKGKQDKDLAAMKTALQYSKKALEAAPDQTYLEFNVAFVQFQIAQMINSLAETQRTLEDVQQAADDLEEAIEAFGVIAKSKTAPYPRSALEQRANMGRNTMRKQLERAVQSQKDYEEKNASKLQQAREQREKALKEREEQERKRREEEEARRQELALARQAVIEETKKQTEKAFEEERLREEAEMTTDSETGEKVKRKRKPADRKRKKKDDDDIVSDGDVSSKRARSTRSPTAVTSNPDEPKRAPKKKRRLERRPAKEKPGKYKSSEIVESDSDDDDIAVPGATDRQDAPTPQFNEDEEMPDPDESEEPDDDAVQVRRKRNTRVLDSDEDEDEDDKGTKGPPTTNGLDRTSVEAELVGDVGGDGDAE